MIILETAALASLDFLASFLDTYIQLYNFNFI